jgi:uncharacterized protein YciI
MHFLLFYEFTPDYLERREPHRNEHLRLGWESIARGELQLGGAFADPADGGALLFRCDDESVPRRFAEADPYVRAGIVTSWRVRKWNTVIGEQAASPVRP